jgi:hypothetical protein
MHPRAPARAGSVPPVGFDEAYRRLRPAMVRLAHLLTGPVKPLIHRGSARMGQEVRP